MPTNNALQITRVTLNNTHMNHLTVHYCWDRCGTGLSDVANHQSGYKYSQSTSKPVNNLQAFLITAKEYGRMKSHRTVTSSALFVAADAAMTCFSSAAHHSLALVNFYAGLLRTQGSSHPGLPCFTIATLNIKSDTLIRYKESRQ
jgi:hypothetical protein